MQTFSRREGQRIRNGLLMHFVGVGLLAGVATLAVYLRLQNAQFAPLLAAVVSVLAAAVAVVLLSRALIGHLLQLDRALDALAHAQPLDAALLRGGWPLTPLFASLRQLQQQEEPLAMRERIMQQVREEAAAEVRTHLAQDLHDSIKQQLFNISISAAAAQARWENDPATARQALAAAQQSAREAQVEMSALLQELRPAPLDGDSLLAALREQAEACGYRTSAQVTLDLDHAPENYAGFPAGIEEGLFRMTQEALANVARHARAHHVSLRLAQEQGALVLEVRDDGQGFAASDCTAGTGMAALRARAVALGGQAMITSAPGKGTLVSVTIPLLRQANGATPYNARQEAIEQAVHRGQRTHQTAENCVALAGILVLLSVPFWLVALAVAAALVAYPRISITRARVAMLAGKTSIEANALRYQEYDVSSAILLFVSLCLWYLPVGLHGTLLGQHFTIGVVVTWVAVAVVLMLSALQALRAYHVTTRWLAQLSSAQRARELDRRATRTASTFALWVIIAIIAVFSLAQVHPALPALTENQWSDDVVMALLIIWPLFLGIEYLYILRWRRWHLRSIL